MNVASAETTTTETTTPPTETPAPNTPEARTEDGTIKDQSTPTQTTTETKPEDKPVDKAPEAYTDFTMPEGRTINKEALGEATTLFKELGLNQESAQKLIDFATKNQISTESAGQTAYNAMREGWRSEVLKDTTLSTGTDLKPEVKQSIGRAIDSLGTELGPQFRQILDISGLGDNPTVVKAMYEMSKFVTEGRPVVGGGPAKTGQQAPDAKPPSIASAMFPKLK